MNQFTKISLLLFIAVGLLLFGCTGPSSSTTSTGQNRTPTTPTQNTTTNTQPSNSALDIAGQTITQLITANLPVKCTISLESGSPLTLYMKGNEKYAMEIPSASDDSACTKTAVLKSGQKIYMGCREGKLFPGSNCEWLEIKINASATNNGIASAAQSPDSYERMPNVNTKCEPWIYDESKFTLPIGAKICTMESLYGVPSVPSE